MDAPTTPLARGHPAGQLGAHSNGGLPLVENGGVHASAPIETPKGPPLAREATGVPGINVAQYANVDVLEQSFGEHIVMRRLTDGSVNATQLLKLAGLDRSRRQKVLDREIGSQFEKVQGGTGKYQGTWVPLSSALELARQYDVLEVLLPLLTFDVHTKINVRRQPTQIEIENQRRALAQNRNVGQRDRQEPGSSGPPSASSQKGDQSMNQSMDQSMADQSITNGDAHGTTSNAVVNQGDGAIDFGGKEPSASEMAAAAAAAASVTSPDTSLDLPKSIPSDDDLVTLEPLDPPDGDEIAESSRDAVTDLFLNSSKGTSETLEEIMARRNIQKIELDVPIDDAGHTALHWAAALGQLALVSDLLKHGANCRRGNRKGESALVRAVLVTNSSDNQTFGELLNLLYPCLHLGDFNGRTVLHHIALTAGIPGRIDASRYYLDALLEWAVRWRGANGVKWLVDELIDLEDSNGDTALNIAARLGSKRIAEQLIEVGASVNICNRAGLGPKDFGMKIESPVENQAQRRSLPPNSTNLYRAGSRAVTDGSERREYLASKCSHTLKDLESRLKHSMDAKNIVLQNMHIQLRGSNDQLAQLSSEKEAYTALKTRKALASQKVAALDAAMEKLNAEFHRGTNQQFANTPLATYDADEPFQIPDENALYSLPPAILEARIRAYGENERKLVELRDKLRFSTLDAEKKFRMVVSKCTSNDVNKVDDIVDDLLTTVTKGDQKMEVD